MNDHDLSLIQAYLDGELDAGASLALEERMKNQMDLAAQLEFYSAVKAAMTKLPPPEVSDNFRARVVSLAPEPQRIDRRQFAAAIVATAVLSSVATWALRGGETPDEAELIAASHRRSLLAASPIDVVSSDRHTVKPWLDAKLGLSPPVVDLSAKGFTLLGGRVDVVGTAPSPTLVYRYREHLISLFTLPDGGAIVAPFRAAGGGLQMVRWSEGGLAYWAVSDAEWSVLEQFAEAFKQGSGT